MKESTQTPERFLKERIRALDHKAREIDGGKDGIGALSLKDQGRWSAYTELLTEVQQGHMSLKHKEAFRANEKGIKRLAHKVKQLRAILDPIQLAMIASRSAPVIVGGSHVQIDMGSLAASRQLANALSKMKPKQFVLRKEGDQFGVWDRFNKSWATPPRLNESQAERIVGECNRFTLEPQSGRKNAASGASAV